MMTNRRNVYTLVLCSAISLGSSLAHAGNPEIEALREEVQRMRADYEARIQQLEARLLKAEAQSAEATESAKAAAQAPAQTGSGGRSSGNAFNPSIGAVLVGSYRSFDNEGESTIQGFAIDEEAGRGEEGFSLGETEINLKANVDDKFLGNLTFALADEDGGTEVELEEAWLQTTSLPEGFTLRMGRFFSDVGYLNQFHVHADDFADRPLPYRAFFGNQLTDDGVRLSWVAPTDLYMEFGTEWLRGQGFPGGGSGNQGKGTWTAFGHLGGDVGSSHSWRLGLSRIKSDVEGRETGEDENGDGSMTSFTGDSDLWVADAVWKWSPNGNSTEKFLKLQAEYFQRDESGTYMLDQPAPAADITLPYEGDASGWYAQAFYQFTRGWRFGLRHAALAVDEPGAAFAGTALERLGHDPEHQSMILEWSNTEFSRLRLQFNHDRSMPESDNQLVLQYIMSIGAHGAHRY